MDTVLTPENMKLIGSTENKIIKDQNGENVPHLEFTEVVLVHCNIIVPNKQFGGLLEISPTNHIFLKIFNSEYDEMEVWFSDQSGQQLEIEDRINLTLVIKWRS